MSDIEQYHISASQIKQFDRCPLSYWFRYVSDIESTKGDNKYLKLGSRVHEAIEAVLQDGWESLDAELLSESFESEFMRLDEYDIPEEMVETGIECCDTASDFIAKKSPDILGIEERIEFKIDRGDVSTEVTAIMDVTTETEIWDWKTGSIRDDTAHGEKIQGSVYMGAYLDAYGRPPERIRFIYLKEGKVRNLDPTDENWQYMLQRAKKLLSGRQNSDYPANPGKACHWCDHEFWCPAAPTGVGGVPWEDY